MIARSSSSRRRGFRANRPWASDEAGLTLQELMVVIAVVAILAGLLPPALGRAAGRARQTSCLSNLKEIGIAYHLYQLDHNGVNVPQRLCPDTPNDPYGLSAGVPSGNGPNFPPPSGPHELWWASFDPTQVPDDLSGAGYQRGLLSPYFDTPSIFKWPVGRQ